MRKYTVIITLLVLAAVCHAQVQVTANVDSARILVGGRSHYTITVLAPQGAKVSFSEYNKKKEILPSMEVLGIATDTTLTDNVQEIRRIYTLTAWDARRYTIPAQKVMVGGKEKMTGTVTLDVQTVPVDTVKNTPMPPDGIQRVPFSWGEWIPVALSLVLSIVLLGISFYLYRVLRSRKRGWKPKKIKTLSFYEQARQDLAKISASRRSYIEQKAFYTDVTNVLRKYISRRFHINAMEMTTCEILEYLHEADGETVTENLKEVFNTADLVKFAKYSTGENDMVFYLDSVARFIDKTKADEPEEAAGEPEREEKPRPHRLLKLAVSVSVAASVALIVYAAFKAYALLV